MPRMDDDSCTTGPVYKVYKQYDPVVTAMYHAAHQAACRNTLDMYPERVEHFKRRITELEKSPNEVVILIANVDDGNGRAIVDVLLPEYDWQEIRDRGEIPLLIGLTDRAFIQEILARIASDAATKLQSMKDKISVVVIDQGTADAYTA